MAAVRSSVLSGSLSRALFYLLFFAGVLAGCGKTGPLYLPDKAASRLHNDTSARQPAIAYTIGPYDKASY